jgi:DNA-binding CsgD family transcriptional regulator
MTKTITGAPHIKEDVILVGRPSTGSRLPDSRARGMSRRRTCTAHLDPDLDIIAADPDFCRLFARTSADICGRGLYDLLHPSAPALLDRPFTRLSEGRGNRVVERVVGLGHSGNVFTCELTAIAVHGASGGLTGIVILVQPDEEVLDSAPDESNGTRNRHLLSKLDAQVLEGIACGASTVQLAARLYLSRQGVEYHVGLMLRKFEAPNRAALVARAHATGMLSVGQWPPRVPPEYIK